jgi:hypothetical protein
MGLDPQEGFTKSDKAGDMQDRIWHELVKLHAVNKEKPTEKFVGRERKTTQEEGEKHHPISARGLGDAIGAVEDELLPSDEEPFPLSLNQIGFFEFRRDPAGRLLTHKYRGSQQSSREVKPKFIDSTQGEPKNIYKP